MYIKNKYKIIFIITSYFAFFNSVFAQLPTIKNEGTDIQLMDKSVIHKDGNLTIIFDHLTTQVLLVSARLEITDTVAIEPCNLAGIIVNPCDTNSISSINEIATSDLFIISTYPNPSNGAITLAIRTIGQSDASINIIDLNGQTVKNFGSIQLHNGENIFVWNKTKDDGNLINSGLYLIVVKSKNRLISTSQLIIK